MKKLLLSILFMLVYFIPAEAQQVRMFQYTTDASGGCQYMYLAQNITDGKFFYCKKSSWSSDFVLGDIVGDSLTIDGWVAIQGNVTTTGGVILLGLASNGSPVASLSGSGTPRWRLNETDTGANFDLFNTGSKAGIQISTAGEGVTFTSTAVTINNDLLDIDFNAKSDTNANAIKLDSGLLSGVGAISFGGAPSSSAFVRINPPALTAPAGVQFQHLLISPGGVTTIPTGTSNVVASVTFEEPGLTCTGTCTVATTAYIKNAPTEGSANFALFIDGGSVRIDMDQDLTEAGAVCITSGNLLSNETDGVCDASSILVKTDVTDLPYGLSEISLMRPVLFRYKESFKPNFQLMRAGFIAEEMAKVIPEVVTYNSIDSTPNGIDYGKLVSVAISGIQELLIKVSDLESEIATLKK
jgi:hypothetical protein